MRNKVVSYQRTTRWFDRVFPNVVLPRKTVAAIDASYPVSNAKGHSFMKRNYGTWLAMFLSVVAGTFCSHAASKFTDGQIEAAISINLTSTESAATVALNRGVSTLGENTKN